MKKLILLGLLASLSLTTPVFAQDDDGAYLDRRYSEIEHPVVVDSANQVFGFAPPKSDVVSLIRRMSPVRSQGSRGTCSIFSATAMLEAMMILNSKATPADADYSEEWLEYLITRTRTDDGSTSTANFRAFLNYGTAPEEYLPYIGETWESADYGLARERCGSLKGTTQKSCLLAHRNPALLNASETELLSKNSALYDPEFAKARRAATDFKAKYFSNMGQNVRFTVSNTATVKQLLAAGIPLTLDLDFFYGAWNHRKAEELGIKRNLDHWSKGIIGYPAPGSVDREKSYEDPAGHSVLVVGYDDTMKVTVPTPMKDGTVKEITYTGVYYFKNSWGSGNFGSEFQVGGVKAAGYGMITQKYAHEFGGFYQFPLGMN